jgi:hypothetical protein
MIMIIIYIYNALSYVCNPHDIPATSPVMLGLALLQPLRAAQVALGSAKDAGRSGRTS